MTRSETQAEKDVATILRRIASRTVPARAGLRELVRLHMAQPEAEGVRYVGEEYGLAELIGIHWGYDDLEERPTEVSFRGRFGPAALDALEAEVARLAQAWLEARGA